MADHNAAPEHGHSRPLERVRALARTLDELDGELHALSASLGPAWRPPTVERFTAERADDLLAALTLGNSNAYVVDVPALALDAPAVVSEGAPGDASHVVETAPVEEAPSEVDASIAAPVRDELARDVLAAPAVPIVADAAAFSVPPDVTISVPVDASLADLVEALAIPAVPSVAPLPVADAPSGETIDETTIADVFGADADALLDLDPLAPEPHALPVALEDVATPSAVALTPATDTVFEPVPLAAAAPASPASEPAPTFELPELIDFEGAAVEDLPPDPLQTVLSTPPEGANLLNDDSTQGASVSFDQDDVLVLDDPLMAPAEPAVSRESSPSYEPRMVPEPAEIGDLLFDLDRDFGGAVASTPPASLDVLAQPPELVAADAPENLELDFEELLTEAKPPSVRPPSLARPPTPPPPVPVPRSLPPVPRVAAPLAEADLVELLEDVEIEDVRVSGPPTPPRVPARR